MIQSWAAVSFLHWPYPADPVQRLLPDGLTVETFDGSAWVGVIPLLMYDVRVPGLPGVPWLSRFPETNLRTYVRGPDGRTGIWFFSLDAARLPAVAAARVGYGLPYFWSSMGIRHHRSGGGGDGRDDYRCRRRIPGPAGVRCDVSVRPGAGIAGTGRTSFDSFLTDRYRLYARFAGRIVAADVAHEPWPLRRAVAEWVDQNLTGAAGLPNPTGDPVPHASTGVRGVRIGRWHPLPAGDRD